MPPIIIAGAIAAAASVASAKVSANASKNAAKTQTAAGQQALAYEREMLARQEAAAKPYQALGNQSLGMLSNSGKAFAPPNLNPYGPQPGVANQAGGYSSTPLPKTSASAAPGNYTMGSLGSMSTPPPSPVAPVQPTLGGNDPLVMVEAPNGQRRQMPRTLAEQFVAKGARIV